MSTTKRVRKGAKQPDPKSGERLLKQAMTNPGVRDLMEVYENWQRLDRPAQAYGQVAAPKSIASSSDTSAPNC